MFRWEDGHVLRAAFVALLLAMCVAKVVIARIPVSRAATGKRTDRLARCEDAPGRRAVAGVAEAP